MSSLGPAHCDVVLLTSILRLLKQMVPRYAIRFDHMPLESRPANTTPGTSLLSRHHLTITGVPALRAIAYLDFFFSITPVRHAYSYASLAVVALILLLDAFENYSLFGANSIHDLPMTRAD